MLFYAYHPVFSFSFLINYFFLTIFEHISSSFMLFLRAISYLVFLYFYNIEGDGHTKHYFI